MKRVGRIFPVIMCLVLCLTLSPISAMAAWSTEGPITPVTPSEEDDKYRPGTTNPWETEGPITPDKPTNPTDPVDPVDPVDPDPTPRPTPTPTPTPGGNNDAGGDVTIEDPDVPLADMPEGDLTEIEEQEVPLSDMPEELTEIEDPEVPLSDMPEEDLTTIEDGDVPLSDVPQTGEASTVVWLAVLLASGMGLVYLNTGKRKENA